MPPRRKRKAKPRGRKKARQLRFRAGQIGAAGGAPVNQFSRVLKLACATQFDIVGAIRGGSLTFDISTASTPCSVVASDGISEIVTAANHPSEWPQLISGGWKEIEVLSSHYLFDVRFQGTSSAKKDFIFAYKFGISFATPIPSPTTVTIGVDNWKDMRQSRGWVWKRFSATHEGGDKYPSQANVRVNIPSVRRLSMKLHGETDITEIDLLHLINTAATFPLTRSALHVVVQTLNGDVFADRDVVIDCTVYQTVRVKRSIQTADMIDEATQVV